MKIRNKECNHKNTDKIKFYKRTWPFGKKSKPTFRFKPHKIIEYCVAKNCTWRLRIR